VVAEDVLFLALVAKLPISWSVPHVPITWNYNPAHAFPVQADVRSAAMACVESVMPATIPRPIVSAVFLTVSFPVNLVLTTSRRIVLVATKDQSYLDQLAFLTWPATLTAVVLIVVRVRDMSWWEPTVRDALLLPIANNAARLTFKPAPSAMLDTTSIVRVAWLVLHSVPPVSVTQYVQDASQDTLYPTQSLKVAVSLVPLPASLVRLQVTTAPLVLMGTLKRTGSVRTISM
jgi:hypothetical protein